MPTSLLVALRISASISLMSDIIKEPRGAMVANLKSILGSAWAKTVADINSIQTDSIENIRSFLFIT
jgi:hypothetical protein